MEQTDHKIIKVLLIEDNQGDARLIQEQLKDVTDMAFEMNCVSQLKEGIDYLARNTVDVILLDLSLPDSPGLETFQHLEAEVPKAPVIVLTGFDNKSVALQAVHDGAQDYLIKGQVEGKTLSRLIVYAIERFNSQADLRNLSLTDSLTGLYNRRGFVTLGEQALKTAHRNKTRLTLFFADVDGLKQINDTFGHKAGDQAITDTAQVLRKTFRDSDILSRLGGDEFVILAMPDAHSQPEHLIVRLQKNLKQHNTEHPDRGYQLSLSLGAAQFDPTGSASIEDLLAKADEVLYFQKKERKGLHPAPTKKWKKVLAFLATVLLLGSAALLFRSLRLMKPRAPMPLSAPVLPMAQPVPAPISVPSPVVPAPVALPAKKVKAVVPVKVYKTTPKSALTPVPAPVPATVPSLPAEEISILRVSYGQQIAPPGSTFGFDLHGSGFTPELLKELSVTFGTPAIEIKNLQEVNAHQVHADIHVDPEAATQYVFPQIVIKGHPPFQAPQPFAVIRVGEVLDVVFTRLDEDGRGGRFRIYTNLAPEMARSFRVKASASGLEVSALEPHLPYAMDGELHLGENIDHGDYDLVVLLGSREIYRKKQMLHVVNPNLGQAGLIESLTAEERYHRPGDNVELFLQGTGFAPEDVETLTARVDEVNMGKPTCTFISPRRIGIYFAIPAGAPEGAYGVLIEQNHQLLWRQKKIFYVVPANWIGGLQMAPLTAGEKGVLKLAGRDFSDTFASTLQLSADDPGLQISHVRRIDTSTLNADVIADPRMAPGDYQINAQSQGVAIKFPGGNLITIDAP